MTRSSRIRKPSQKAREIAEAALSKPTLQSNRKTSETTTKGLSSRAKVRIGARKGRATIDSNGDVAVEEEAAAGGAHLHTGSADEDHSSHSDLENEHDPDTLYCICLGHDDHTPMIQCEGCENWFHFSCIKLDPTEAQKIAAFYCQVCHASGNGFTRKINEEVVAPEEIVAPEAIVVPEEIVAPDTMPDSTTKSIPSTPDRTLENNPTEAAIGETIPEDLNIDKALCPPVSESVDLNAGKNSPKLSSSEVMKRSSSDSSKETEAGPTQVVGDSTPAPSKANRRKPKPAEGLSSDEDTSDQDFTGDEPLRAAADRKRKTPTTTDSRPPAQPRLSISTPFSTTPPTPTTPVPGADKTRKSCTEQFFKLLEPIFYNQFKQDGGDTQDLEIRNRSEEAAIRFSEAVESELFETFAEPDANNQKAPRRQYMTKLRSLLFNLKNNPAFLNSLSSSDLSPRSIVCMSHEDLQTPKQKALAEQVRQRSLHDSVKTLVPGLESIIPQKADEPAIASFSQPITAGKDVAAYHTHPAKQEHPDSHQRGDILPGVLTSKSYPAPIAHIQDQLSQSKPSPAPNKSETGRGSGRECQDLKENAQPTASESTLAENSTSKGLNSNLLGSFDLEKVFAAIRSVPASLTVPTNPQSKGPKEAKEGESEDSMDLENTPERELAENPQASTNQAGTEMSLPDDYDPFALANGVDADLDAILHGDSSIPCPPGTTQEPELPTAGSTQAPTVWTGNVMTADAGGFAACAVQVGGRALSPDGFTWSKLIPTDTLTVVGRLSVRDSTNYLVQSHFTPTRELVILELRPNLKGPPDLPSPDRVTQHKQNLIEFFTKKGRHAVVAVNDKVKQTVRDIYLVPILRQEPLPEFVQLLDDVSIPESTPRDQDMMIAVLVLSKGIIPSAWKPTSTTPTDSSFNPGGLAPMPQAEAAPILAAPNHPSAAPYTTSYPVPAVQGTSSSAPLYPNPLLQSLSNNLSSGSTQLPYSLLSQLPSTVAPNPAPGPPPGFVPYVAPQSQVPAAVSSPDPSANTLDLSQVDVSALQALLANQQALKPILAHSSTPGGARSHGQPKPQYHPPAGSMPPPGSSTYRNGGGPHGTHDGARASARAAPVPTPPRPANLPLNPHFNGPPAMQHAWTGAEPSGRPAFEPYPSARDGPAPRKGLMRMGDIRPTPSPDDFLRRRTSLLPPLPGPQPSPIPARAKRHSQEFVAPPRDAGWAGRGRARKL